MVTGGVPFRVPTLFQPAIRALQALAEEDRYRAALVFGSVARCQADGASDLDAIVVTAEPAGCGGVNHPRIGGVKLDVSFRSIDELRTQTAEEVQRNERVPMVAESVVLFDKDGDLGALRDEARRIERKPVDSGEHGPVDSGEHGFLLFLVHHADDKARRTADPAAALLAMDEGLGFLLGLHYRLHRRWWVSSKRRLADLRAWDPPMAELVAAFVATADVDDKLGVWEKIVARVVEPMGGRRPVEETGCACPICTAGVAALQGDDVIAGGPILDPDEEIALGR